MALLGCSEFRIATDGKIGSCIDGENEEIDEITAVQDIQEMNELAHSSKELIIEDDMAELSTSDGKQTHLCDMLHTNGNAHDEHAASIVWWTNVFCVPFIACVGLACNAFNLLILTTNSSAKRIPSVDLLLALALFDSLFLIFGTIELTPPSIYWLISSPFFNYLYIHSVLYMRTLSSTFYKTSVLVVVAFNVERYICVCHPLHSNRLWTTRTSRTAIVICLTASFLSSLQWPICYRIQECKDHSLMRNFYIIALSENINLQLYYQFMDFLSLITFNMLPIVALLSLNTRLIITLRKVMGRDAARTSYNIPHNDLYGTRTAFLSHTAVLNRFNANAILFAVVVLLLVCVGPQAPARLLFDYYGQYHETAIVYICVTQQLVFLNASLNFCLYCLVSRRYRSMLQQTIKRLFGNAWKYDSSTVLKRLGRRPSQQGTTTSDVTHLSSKRATRPRTATSLLDRIERHSSHRKCSVPYVHVQTFDRKRMADDTLRSTNIIFMHK